jgi:hypothetical protein
MKVILVSAGKLHLLYEPGYITLRVGNITEEKSRVGMSEFPTGVSIPEVCSKQNPVTL